MGSPDSLVLGYDRSSREETSIRGPDLERTHETFTASPGSLVPADHPLRPVKAMADAALTEPVWSPTTYSKNRDRFLQGEVAIAFFN